MPRALLQAFVGARYLIDRQPATLQQAVVSEFMQQGHFAAHIRRMRQLYRDQRDALAETLMRRATDRLDGAVPDQGMHLVAYLRDGPSDSAIEAADETSADPTSNIRMWAAGCSAFGPLRRSPCLPTTDHWHEQLAWFGKPT